MKKTLFILTTLILLCGCRTKTNEDTTPILTVSIEPMRYFVEQLVGDNFQVQSLVPGGRAPELY